MYLQWIICSINSVYMTCPQPLTPLVMIPSFRSCWQGWEFMAKFYLMDRCQSVCVSGVISASRNLIIGFPTRICHRSQWLLISLGSCFSNCFKQHIISVDIYADDTQLSLPFAVNKTDANRVVIQMEDCINHIQKWIAQHSLKLKGLKTGILICVPSHQTSNASSTVLLLVAARLRLPTV